MANNVSSKGFFPHEYKGGGSWDGKVSMYYIASGDNTATFVGDIVKMSDSSAAASTADMAYGCPLVVQAAAGASTDIHVGCLVSVNQHLGVSSANLNMNRIHRPASVGMYVYVADAPSLVMVGQSDDDTETGTQDHVGANADIIVAAGSTTTGISGMEIDTTTVETTATLPLKIVGVVLSPDNNIANGKLKYKCMINAGPYKAGTLGMDD
jgi:hypothetical protein